MGEPEKIERFRFSQLTQPPVAGREPAKLNQPRLLWVQFQAELQESLLQLCQELFRVKPMLEANNEVVAVTHDNNIAMRPLLPPLLYP